MAMPVEQAPGQQPVVQDTIPWTREEMQGRIVARFERVARAYPDATAVQGGAQRMSYAQLNAAANRIAHALRARLGDGNVPVASLLSDRARVIPALLGMFKAAKIYTPLAPEQPGPRLQQILDDAGAHLMLVDSAHRALAAQLGMPAERLLDLDGLDPDLPAHDPRLDIPPENFASIIYTSGSTGRPKGVAQRNGTLMGSVLGSMSGPPASVNLHVGARALLMASPGYAVVVLHTLVALLNGATIFPFALEAEGLANLRDFLLRERVSRLAVTASIFRHFMASLCATDQFPDVRYVALFGEPMLRRDFELFKQHFPAEAVAATGLGSTEVGRFSDLTLTHQSIITDSIVPAGYPTRADLDVYIADDAGRRAGPGEIGEITVKGRVMPVYWHDPARSAQAFTPDPDGSGRLIFRTGDLGLLRTDGMLEHRGRKDFQVKVRGSRVELGEIEMALFELGNIREAVVVARPDADGEMQLIAYVVPERLAAPTPIAPLRPDDSLGTASAPELPGPKDDAPPVDGPGATLLSSAWLRRRLAEKLPASMVPTAFVLLETLPLSLSGKIDRAQLPQPELPRATRGPAADALEAQLARIWQALLNVPEIGPREDFFELGGNSLLAMRLFSEIQQMLGRKLPLSILFQASTIAELAARIRAADPTGAGESCLVPIQTGGVRRPFFLAAGGFGGDGELLVYARLARYLSPEQPLYGLRARAVPAGQGANDEVEAIAAGHVAEIRALQPHGPYLLGGECIGGVVAIEMARQLRAQGEEVALLCLLDTVRPTWRTRLGGRRSWMTHRWHQTLRQAARTARSVHRAARGRPPLAKARVVGRLDLRYVQATMRYRAGRCGERITLLVNEELHRSDPTLGWQGLAGGGLEVHALPGTHETYIRENVQATGECLRHCLERAQEKETALAARSQRPGSTQ